MEEIMRLKFFIFLMVIFISGSNCFKLETQASLNNFPNKSNSLICDVTCLRVFIDGIWWIIVSQDGVIIDEYPDPNQT